MIYAVTEVNGKQDFGTISRLSSSSRKAGTGSPSAEARTSTTNLVFPLASGRCAAGGELPTRQNWTWRCSSRWAGDRRCGLTCGFARCPRQDSNLRRTV